MKSQLVPQKQKTGLKYACFLILNIYNNLSAKRTFTKASFRFFQSEEYLYPLSIYLIWP